MKRNPLQVYRAQAIASARRHHRPERHGLFRRRTGNCQCGMRIGNASCWILAQNLRAHGVAP